MWVLFVLPISILLVVMALPLPYNIRWTAKLLRRDVRNLRTKCTTILERKFKLGEVVGITSLHHADEARKLAGASESFQLIVKPSEHASEGRVYFKALRDVPATGGEKSPGTLYELMEERLRATYASRDRNVSHEDRWRFRGSWLLLYKAIQACPSNDSYDVTQDGARDGNEKRMLLEMLPLSADPTRSSTHTVGKIPAAPYARHNGDHDRYDSMLSKANTLPPTSSTAQIWLSILEATNDATKIAPVAEELLHHIWSEKRAIDIIEQIGDPHKRYSDADDTELRVKLRGLPCPKFMYSTL